VLQRERVKPTTNTHCVDCGTQIRSAVDQSTIKIEQHGPHLPLGTDMMIADGLLNKQIAYQLGVSEATIKAHMTAVLRKMGVNNRTQAVLAVQRLRINAPALMADESMNDAAS